MQKKTLDTIVESGNSFIVQVKENQPNLCKEIRKVEHKFNYKDTHIINKNENAVKNTWQIYQYPFKSELEKWKSINTLLVVHKTIIGKERLVHYKRYYFSDNQICKAEDFNHAIRNHWGIENYAHRPKDICFNQDENQINIHNKAVNVAVFNTL